jgi:hypothetical protein
VFRSGAPRNDAGPVTARIAPTLKGPSSCANALNVESDKVIERTIAIAMMFLKDFIYVSPFFGCFEVSLDEALFHLLSDMSNYN